MQIICVLWLAALGSASWLRNYAARQLLSALFTYAFSGSYCLHCACPVAELCTDSPSHLMPCSSPGWCACCWGGGPCCCQPRASCRDQSISHDRHRQTRPAASVCPLTT